jgi:hypothetical protein
VGHIFFIAAAFANLASARILGRTQAPNRLGLLSAPYLRSITKVPCFITVHVVPNGSTLSSCSKARLMSFTDQTPEDSSMVHCVARVRKAENHPQIRHAKSKLLVLDSDIETLHAIVEVAKPYFQVIQTSDPQWAMAWLGQYRDVTVFLVDEDLQQGSGSQLLLRSQAMRPEVLRVLMSRTVDNPNVVQSLKRGIAQTLLEKPMSREALLAAIVPQSVEQSDTPHLIVA